MNNMNLIPALPEIFLTICASAILLIDMHLSDSKRHITYLLSLATLAVLTLMSLAAFNSGETIYIFHNMYVSDPMSNLLKAFSYIAVAVTLVYSRRYVEERGMLGGYQGGEFYVLALFSLLGRAPKFKRVPVALLDALRLLAWLDRGLVAVALVVLLLLRPAAAVQATRS